MSNAGRALRQVISLDGWIANFDDDETATVHVDVVFREGKFGSDDTDRVRFRLALKRAEIVLFAPDSEPLRVIRSSVRRSPVQEGQTQQVIDEVSGETRGKAGVSVKTALSTGGELSLEGEARRSITKRRELTEKVGGHFEQHFTTVDGHPAWEICAIGLGQLSGAPWDAVDAPRLKVKRLADRNADGDKPTLRLEVRCLREDIEISDLELKEPDKQKWFSRRANRDVNLAAAEQVIKEELLSAGFLRVSDLSEKHGELMIADLIVSEDWW